MDDQQASAWVLRKKQRKLLNHYEKTKMKENYDQEQQQKTDLEPNNPELDSQQSGEEQVEVMDTFMMAPPDFNQPETEGELAQLTEKIVLE